MSLELLDKTRKINNLLNQQKSETINFNDFCRVLSSTLHVNVLLLSKKGKVLGLKEKREITTIPQFTKMIYGAHMDAELNERLNNILSTKENVNLMTLGLTFENQEEYQTMISPVNMAGRRLGTLLVYRQKEAFGIDDIILAEYGTMVIGLAMQRAEGEEISEELHKEQKVSDAIHTLSKLEAQAMLYVIDELEEAPEGILVTSKLADKVGITRSVIVNALKKCESAGVLKTKSSGMRGTSIKVINDLFCCETIQNLLKE